jgi:hypothetical protein
MYTSRHTVALAAAHNTWVLAAAAHDIAAPALEASAPLVATTAMEGSTTLEAVTARIEAAVPRVEAPLAVVAIHGCVWHPPSHHMFSCHNFLPG